MEWRVRFITSLKVCAEKDVLSATPMLFDPVCWPVFGFRHKVRHRTTGGHLSQGFKPVSLFHFSICTAHSRAFRKPPHFCNNSSASESKISPQFPKPTYWFCSRTQRAKESLSLISNSKFWSKFPIFFFENHNIFFSATFSLGISSNPKKTQQVFPDGRQPPKLVLIDWKGLSVRQFSK